MPTEIMKQKLRGIVFPQVTMNEIGKKIFQPVIYNDAMKDCRIF
jgi:hypothetical protein